MDDVSMESMEAAKAAYQRGLERYLQGNTDNAITLFTEAIRLDSAFTATYLMRGAIQENVILALSDYTEAIRLNPDYVQAYYNRGFLRGSLGDFAGAIEDFRQVLMRQPDHPQANNIRLDIAEWRTQLR